jgi:hypothetical protein
MRTTVASHPHHGVRASNARGAARLRTPPGRGHGAAAGGLSATATTDDCVLSGDRRAPRDHVAGPTAGSRRSFANPNANANANLHFHTLVPEGVWHELADGSVTFHPLPPPTDEDVQVLAARIVRRVTRLLARRDADTTGDDEVDALAQAQAEAVQPPLPLVEPRAQSPSPARHRCALVDGFSLHANTVVDAADRRCSGKQALEAVGVRIDGADAITASGQCVVTVRGSEINGRITMSGQAKVHIEDSSVQAATMSGQAKLHSRGTRYSSAPQRSGQARVEDLGGNTW